jgi:hypothetical protein
MKGSPGRRVPTSVRKLHSDGRPMRSRGTVPTYQERAPSEKRRCARVSAWARIEGGLNAGRPSRPSAESAHCGVTTSQGKRASNTTVGSDLNLAHESPCRVM